MDVRFEAKEKGVNDAVLSDRGEWKKKRHCAGPK